VVLTASRHCTVPAMRATTAASFTTVATVATLALAALAGCSDDSGPDYRLTVQTAAQDAFVSYAFDEQPLVEQAGTGVLSATLGFASVDEASATAPHKFVATRADGTTTSVVVSPTRCVELFCAPDCEYGTRLVEERVVLTGGDPVFRATSGECVGDMKTISWAF
jgi:hypothetical protein